MVVPEGTPRVKVRPTQLQHTIFKLKYSSYHGYIHFGKFCLGSCLIQIPIHELKMILYNLIVLRVEGDCIIVRSRGRIMQSKQ